MSNQNPHDEKKKLQLREQVNRLKNTAPGLSDAQALQRIQAEEWNRKSPEQKIEGLSKVLYGMNLRIGNLELGMQKLEKAFVDLRHNQDVIVDEAETSITTICILLETLGISSETILETRERIRGELAEKATKAAAELKAKKEAEMPASSKEVQEAIASPTQASIFPT
jgi:hypothetical protein